MAYERKSNNIGNKILYYDKDNKTATEIIDDDSLKALHGFTMRTKKAREEVKKYSDKISRVEASKNSKFEIIPYSIGSDSDDFKRNAIVVQGRAGSGKSYIAKQITNTYRKMGIKKIYLITDVPDDDYKAKLIDINDLVVPNNEYEIQKEEYENMKIAFKYKKKAIDDPDTLIKMEQNLLKMKPRDDLKNKLEFVVSDNDIKRLFSDCVLILDDYENNVDRKKIEFLQDFLLNYGRHNRCNMIIIRHQALGGVATSLIKSELTNLIVFQGSSAHQKRVLLGKYLGLSPEEIKRINLSLKKSRWVNINMGVMPSYVLSQHEAYII